MSARHWGGADERSFEAIRQLRKANASAQQLPLPAFKSMLREQFFMLLIDEEAALGAIPGLLPDDAETRRKALDALTGILKARGPLADDSAVRLERIATLFGTHRSVEGPDGARPRTSAASKTRSAT